MSTDLILTKLEELLKKQTELYQLQLSLVDTDYETDGSQAMEAENPDSETDEIQPTKIQKILPTDKSEGVQTYSQTWKIQLK